MVTKKKKGWLMFCVISLLGVPVTVYVAFLVDQFFTMTGTQETFYQLNLNYLSAWSALLTNQKVVVFFVILQGLYMAFWLLEIFFKQNHSISQGETMMVTPSIWIPVPAGNGEYGTARFMTEEEKKGYFTEAKIDDEKSPPGHLVIEWFQKGKTEYFRYITEPIHCLIVGITRSGKTRRFLLQCIFKQILSGYTFFAPDVKGELFSLTSRFAKVFGYIVFAIDFRKPKLSARYNYLQMILNALKVGDMDLAIEYTWDIVAALVEKPKGEPLWYNGECAAIAASILIVAQDAPPKCRNMTNVYYFMAYMCEVDKEGNMPINSYLAKLPTTHPAKIVFAQAKIAPARTKASFFTSALSTLRLFTSPNIANMTAESDFDLRDAAHHKTGLYLILPDEKETYHPLAALFMTLFHSACTEVAQDNGGILPVPVVYDADELGNMPYLPCLHNILTAGAGRREFMLMVIQAYQQLESKYPSEWKTIRSQCAKIYLRTDDEDTLKAFSESMSSYTIASRSASMNSQQTNDNMSQSSSINLTGRNLLFPNEILLLDDPYALMLIPGRRPQINVLPDISKTLSNELMGLGSAEHNQKLAMEIDQERTANMRQPGYELWGIWEKYAKDPFLPEPETEPFAGEKITFLKGDFK